MSAWTGDRIYKIHMGAPRDYAREGRGDWAAPCEPIREAGCPGSWYRGGWLDSLRPYMRRRDDNGGRVENPRFSRCTDDLVIEAVLLVEALEDIWLAEARAADYAKLRKDATNGR